MAISVNGHFPNINYSMLGHIFTFLVDILKYYQLVTRDSGSDRIRRKGQESASSGRAVLSGGGRQAPRADLDDGPLRHPEASGEPGSAGGRSKSPREHQTHQVTGAQPGCERRVEQSWEEPQIKQ